MASQVFAFGNDESRSEVRYRVRGRLFGTRRFRDEGRFELGQGGGERQVDPPLARGSNRRSLETL